jgi:hypothetical protein
LLNVRTSHYKMCVAPPWPFSISQSHSCNSCALAIASGSDKQSECCRTHRVIVIAMKSKGNNNKPILKSCDYHNVATTEKIPLRWFVSVCRHTATSQFIRNEPDESTQMSAHATCDLRGTDLLIAPA